MFADKRVLITGGLGFIGSNLARRLLDCGAQVSLVDSLVPEHGGNRFNIDGIEDRVHLHVGDVRDEGRLSTLIQGKDFLFNLAGQTSHMDSMDAPQADLESNCRAQLCVLEACRRHNPGVRVIFASTRQIYGRPQYLPVDEKHPLRPIDVNGVDKLAGEGYHAVYADAYGIRSCALRLTNTIGPRMRIKDARQTFLGLWVRLILEGKPFEVWEGRQLRDLTYVDDAVEAFLLSAAGEDSYGQAFNIGGDGVFSLESLAALLVKVNGRGEYRIRPFPPERKRIDIGDYHADFSKIEGALGWRPKVTVADALDRTLRFYRENLDRYL